MDTSGNELFQTKQQLREQQQEQERNQLAEERMLAYSVIRSRLPEHHSLHGVIANAYGKEQITFTCDRNDQLISMLKASLDDERNYSFYLGIAEGRLRPRQWISSEIPSVKGSDSDIYEKVHPSEKYWGSYLSFGMEEKNSKVSDEALDYGIFVPDGVDKMTGHVPVNGKFVVKPEPGILRIYFNVSKEAPKIYNMYGESFDSLNVIKLNNVPYEGSNPEKKTTAVICPRRKKACRTACCFNRTRRTTSPFPSPQLLQMLRLQSFEQRMVLQLLKRRLLMEQLKHRLLVLQLRQRSLLLLVRHRYMLERLRKNRLLFQLLKERMEFQRLLKNHLLELGQGLIAEA
ncbi:hypothetical protein MTO96_007062 [Rhipicephalus appendiculatus]